MKQNYTGILALATFNKILQKFLSCKDLIELDEIAQIYQSAPRQLFAFKIKFVK